MPLSESELTAQTSRYQQFGMENRLILSMQTDFTHHGEVAAWAGYIGQQKMNARFRLMQSEVQEAAVQILRDHTPVDTGNLQESTYAVSTQVGDFYSIDLFQDAMNSNQTAEYAPFVILGHMSRGSTYVPPNPYNADAYPELYDLVTAAAFGAAQEVASEMTSILGQDRVGSGTMIG